MAERICNRCGRKGDVRYGKHCERGHFICGRHDHGTYCSICSTKYLGATDTPQAERFPSWREERDFLLETHAAEFSAFELPDAGSDKRPPFLTRFFSQLDVRPQHKALSRGATIERLQKILRQAEYHPQPPEIHEHTAWIDCSVKEDGSGVVHVILYRDTDAPEKYWGCEILIVLKRTLTPSQLDDMNFETFGLCFHNHFDTTCIEGAFLLEAMNDEAIEFNFRYTLLAALQSIGKILDR